MNKTLNQFIDELQIFIKANDFKSCTDLLLNAIDQYPNEDKLKLNLGNVYKVLGQKSNSIAIYTSLLNTSYQKIAQNNLSLIMLEEGNINEAIQYARSALEDNNDYSDAKFNLSLGLCENKEYLESLEICNSLLSDKEYKDRSHELKIRIEQITCNWDHTLETKKLLLDNEIIVHPFLHISHIPDEKSNSTNAKKWNANQNYKELRKPPFTKVQNKVKIGFFCGEIRNHPTFYLIKDFFKNLDRNKFTTYMFSYDHESYQKSYIERNFNDFIDITSLSRTESYNTIKGYDLDVLIDLTTIISHNRSDIIQQDIAKINIAYLAFPGTTGSYVYDYILTDKIVTPEKQQENYVEHFLYLPKTYQVNNGDINTDIKDNKIDYQLPEKSIVLGCLNQSFKLDPIFFNIWINILQEYDDTYLWLLNYGDVMRDNINKFVNKRVSSNRIIFADRVDYQKHLKRIQHIDIALDTRVYNGHTTTIEMIQAGVPLVTLKGTHFASRVSSSILSSLELDSLITESYSEYEKKIISLIDKEYNLSVKDLIKKKINNSSILNVKNFAKDFEKTILKCFK